MLAEFAADFGAHGRAAANDERIERVAGFHGSKDRSSDAFDFGKLVEIGEHAVGILVAVIEKFFGDLLVAISGVGREEQGILLGKNCGGGGRRRGMAIGS